MVGVSEIAVTEIEGMVDDGVAARFDVKSALVRFCVVGKVVIGNLADL